MNGSVTHLGSYLLQLILPYAKWIKIGKLGSFSFPAGCYVYVGSAFGPGGITARLRRHINKKKIKHWHIDFLRSECELIMMLGLIHDNQIVGSPLIGTKMECIWSQALITLEGVSSPVVGFGSSDCTSGCRSHLMYLTKENSIDIKQELIKITPGVLEINGLNL